MKSAKTIFKQHLKEKGMLVSRQREQILAAFMKARSHLTIDDLCNTVRKKNPKIGLATVYQAMKVICLFFLDVKLRNGSRNLRITVKTGV